MNSATLWITLLWFLLSQALARAAFLPASIPLSIRSPYVNTWFIATEGSQPLSNAWPTFWTQSVCSRLLASYSIADGKGIGPGPWMEGED